MNSSLNERSRQQRKGLSCRILNQDIICIYSLYLLRPDRCTRTTYVVRGADGQHQRLMSITKPNYMATVSRRYTQANRNCREGECSCNIHDLAT